MKKNELIFTFLFISLFSYCQSIEETIDYINKTSYIHFEQISWTADLFGGKDGDTEFKDGEFYYKTEDTFRKGYIMLSLDSKGLLTIQHLSDIYVIPVGTLWTEDLKNDEGKRELKTKGEVKYTRYIYLKQLSDSISIQEPGKISLQSYSSDNYDCLLYFYCENGCDCIASDTHGMSTRNYGGFYVNGFEYAQRVKNAFIHLIKLAKENPDFWEKDPFTN
jgi:hypothetical protein